jgi:hypothetical protein
MVHNRQRDLLAELLPAGPVSAETAGPEVTPLQSTSMFFGGAGQSAEESPMNGTPHWLSQAEQTEHLVDLVRQLAGPSVASLPAASSRPSGAGSPGSSVEVGPGLRVSTAAFSLFDAKS